LDKNKHTLSQELTDLCYGSSNKLVSALFIDVEDAKTTVSLGTLKRGTAATSVGFMFKKQLDDLMVILKETTPHYVRCIKPNPKQLPLTFEDKLVIEQLSYLGMMDTVKIRKMGFPIRLAYQEFVGRYGILTKRTPSKKVERTEVETIFKALNLLPIADYQIGLTKIFLKFESVSSKKTLIIFSTKNSKNNETLLFILELSLFNLFGECIPLESITKSYEKPPLNFNPVFFSTFFNVFQTLDKCLNENNIYVY
jgi:hypothetical protein